MDDDDYGDVIVTTPSRPFRWIDLAVVATHFARDLAGAVEDSLDLLHQVILSHANHKVDQATFREEAALEIERIVNGDT